MTPNHLQKIPELGQPVYISVCCAEWQYDNGDWVMGTRYKFGIVTKIEPHTYNWTHQLVTVVLKDKTEHLSEAGQLLEVNPAEAT